METEYLGWLVGIAFFAGVIDSIAGGGGLLTLPSILFTGISPDLALGTNKFSGMCGAMASTFNFARKRLIEWKIFFWGAGFTLLGGFLGSQFVLLFDPQVIQVLILIFLPLAAISLFVKKREQGHVEQVHLGFKAAALALALGFYDGFFGPGTGTFLTIGLYHIFGLNLVHATALAKPFNWVSNLAASVVFGFHGKILWIVALPMALAGVLGNWAGSHLAMRQGALWVQKALVGVCILLFVSLAMRLSLIYKWLSW